MDAPSSRCGGPEAPAPPAGPINRPQPQRSAPRPPPVLAPVLHPTPKTRPRSRAPASIPEALQLGCGGPWWTSGAWAWPSIPRSWSWWPARPGGARSPGASGSAWWAVAVFGGFGGSWVPGWGRNGRLWRCGGALSAGFGGLQRRRSLSGPFPPRPSSLVAGSAWWRRSPAPGASGSAWWVLAVWHAGRLVWGMPWPAVARPRPLGPPARPGGSRRRCGVGIGAASVAVWPRG